MSIKSSQSSSPAEQIGQFLERSVEDVSEAVNDAMAYADGALEFLDSISDSFVGVLTPSEAYADMVFGENSTITSKVQFGYVDDIRNSAVPNPVSFNVTTNEFSFDTKVVNNANPSTLINMADKYGKDINNILGKDSEVYKATLAFTAATEDKVLKQFGKVMNSFTTACDFATELKELVENVKKGSVIGATKDGCQALVSLGFYCAGTPVVAAATELGGPGAGMVAAYTFGELGNKVKEYVEIAFDELDKGFSEFVENVTTIFNEQEEMFESGCFGSLLPGPDGDPLTIDFDGDGIELIGIDQSTVLFDMQGDGSLQRVGWVAPDDGILVWDRNSDGFISDRTEMFSDIMFNNADSGVAALAMFDSNHDGQFDTNDVKYDEVQVWRDLDQDAVSDEGELFSLSSLGIESIKLNRDDESYFVNGNVVLGVTHAIINGEIHEVADVGLSSYYSKYELVEQVGDAKIYLDNRGEKIAVVSGTAHNFDQDLKEVQNIYGGVGNDEISLAGKKSALLLGKAGNDILSGGAGDDTISGGTGSDSLSGGAGNDNITIDSEDAYFHGGSGVDELIVESDDDFTIDLGATSFEIVESGAGNDSFTAGNSAVVVTAGGGDDCLIGSNKDDYFRGGGGNDYFDGGDGDDSALFAGDSSEYTVLENTDGSVTVKHNYPEGYGEGEDTLVSVERIIFKDKTVHLSASNNAPIAKGDSGKGKENQDIVFTKYDLLKNDSDKDFDILSIASVGKTIGGSVRLGFNDSVIFTPDEGFSGEASFEYKVDDGHGGKDSAKVTIDIEADNKGEFFEHQWHFEAMNIPEVWKDYTGAGVFIGNNENTGVDYTHTDIAPNYDKSKDYNYRTGARDGFVRDRDPSNSHGTGTTGIIAAANDGKGVLGIAYNASITNTIQEYVDGLDLKGQSQFDVAIRFATKMYYGKMTPAEIARAKVYTKGNLFSPLGKDDIFINDQENALRAGRNGLGTVFVSPGGNDRKYFVDSNYTTKSNSRRHISVAAIGKDFKHMHWSNPGASLLITAPGDEIITTNVTNFTETTLDDYRFFGGTCGSSAVVAGVAALILEANPQLGWRDVQEIFAYSAVQNDPTSESWATNGANNWNGGGLHVSHDDGYGLVDALAAVRLAEVWTETSTHDSIGAGTSANEVSVSGTRTCYKSITDGDSAGISDSIHFNAGIDVQTVEVHVNISHTHIGDLELILTSPDGTQSVLLNRIEKNPDDPNDTGADENNINWTFMTTHNWGEISEGDWTLTVKDHRTGDTGRLNYWKLTAYGDAATADNTYVYTNEYKNFAGDEFANRRVLNDAEGIDTINAAAVTTDQIINLEAGATSWVAENTLKIGDDVVIENAFTGDGDDILVGNDSDNYLRGGRGDDRLIGGKGADRLDGGRGDDLVSYAKSESGISVNLTGASSGGDAEGDVITNVESVIGSDHNDSFTGNAEDNKFSGGLGEDTMHGGAGADLLLGGEGADTLFGDAADDEIVGGAGDDIIDGGAGNDTVRFSGYMDDYTISDVVNGKVTVTGADGIDTISNAEFLQFADQTKYIGVNLAPQVQDFSYDMQEEGTLEVSASDIIAGITDPEGDTVSISSFLNPQHGQISVDSSGNVKFVADKDFTGAASFDYAVEDGNGNEVTATVHINVENVNDAPTFTSCNIIVTDGSAVSGQFQASDIDDDDSSLKYSVLEDAGHGSVVVDEDGTYSYTADNGYHGDDVFKVQVTDPSGAATVLDVPVRFINQSASQNVFQVNDNLRTEFYGTDKEMADQMRPAITALSGGRFAVAYGGYGEDTDVYTKIYDAAGNQLTEERRVNSQTSSHQLETSITALEGGGYLVVWNSYEGKNYICGQRFDDLGNPQGNEFLISSEGRVGQEMPAVTSLENGGFVAVWSDWDGASKSDNVYARQFDSRIQAIGEDIIVSGGQEQYRVNTNILSLSDGGYMIMWDNRDVANESKKYNVFAQRFSAQGEKVGAEFQVNQKQNKINYGRGIPQAVELVNGDVLIVWNAYYDNRIAFYSQRYDSKGDCVGEVKELVNIRRCSGSSKLNGLQSLAATADGGFTIAWADYKETNIKQQTFNANGQAVSEIEVIADYSEDENATPSLVTLDNGQTVVVWQSAENSSAASNVNGIILGDGTAVPLRGTAENDQIFGGAGNDTLIGYSGSDVLNGRAGVDIASYKDSAEGVSVNLATSEMSGGDAENDTLVSIEGVEGSKYSDTLVGNEESNVLISGGGNDSLRGNGGEDTFVITRDYGAVTTISDFDPSAGDVLDLSAFDEISDFSKLRSATTMDGDNTVIKLSNGQSIVLENFDSTSLKKQNILGAAGTNLIPTLVSDIWDTEVIANPESEFSLNLAEIGKDADGDQLTYSVTCADGSALPAWLSFDGTVLSGTPALTDVANQQLKVTVTDESGASVNKEFSLSVPLWENSSSVVLNTDEDSNLTISAAELLANVSIRSPNLRVLNLTCPSEIGSIVTDGDGQWTFKPTENWNGEVSFIYDVGVEGGPVISTEAVMQVAAVNDAPIFSSTFLDSGFNNSEQIIYSSDLLAFVDDVDGDILSVTDISVLEGQGVLESNGDGSWTYRPIEGVEETLKLSFTVSDGSVSRTGSASLELTNFNYAPVVESGLTLNSTQEEVDVTFQLDELLAGASDPEGLQLSVSDVVIESGEGEIVNNSDGSWTFKSAKDWYGTAEVSYNVSDGEKSTKSVKSFQVSNINDAPVFNEEVNFGSVDEGDWKYITLAELVAGVSDVDDSDLSISNLRIESGAGTIEAVGPNRWKYTTSVNNPGPVTFKYDVSDGEASVEAGASLNVLPVDKPVVTGSVDFGHMNEDGTFTITTNELLGNIAGGNGEKLSVENVNFECKNVSIEKKIESFDFEISKEIDSNLRLGDYWGGGRRRIVYLENGKFIYVDKQEVALYDQSGHISKVIYTLGETEYLFGGTSCFDGGFVLYGCPSKKSDNDEKMIFMRFDQTGAQQGPPLQIDTNILSNTSTHFHNDRIRRYYMTPYVMSVGDRCFIRWSDYAENEGSVWKCAYINSSNEIISNLAIGTDSDYELLHHAPQRGIYPFNGGYLVLEKNKDDIDEHNTLYRHTIYDFEGQLISQKEYIWGSSLFADRIQFVELPEQKYAFVLCGEHFISGSIRTCVFDKYGNEIESNSYIDRTYRPNYRPGSTFAVADGFLFITTSRNNSSENSGVAWLFDKSGKQIVKTFDFDAPYPDAVIYNAIQKDNAYIIHWMIDGASTSQNMVFSTYLVNESTSYTFTPPEDWNGELDITYDVKQGNIITPNSAKITVDAVNDAPVKNNDNLILAEAAEDAFRIISVAELTSNITDIDSTDLNIENLTVADNAGTISDNGDGTWNFVSAKDFNGKVTLNYDVTDGEFSVANSAEMNVVATNDAPVVSDPVILGGQIEEVDFVITRAELIANASDIDTADNSHLNVQNLAVAPEFGTIVDNGDGTWTFKPAKDFTGTAKFTYDITDGEASVSTEVSFDVSNVNDAPVAGDPVQLSDVAEDGTLNFSAADLLANTTDIDNLTSELTVTNVVLLEGEGVVSGDSVNGWTFKSAGNWNGTAKFGYDVSDGEYSVSTSALVDVTPVNDAPVAGSSLELGTIAEDGELLVSAEKLLSAVSDVEDGVLFVSEISVPESVGELVDNGDGTWTFRPALDWNGTADISYVVSDGELPVSATASAIVTPVNDAPRIGITGRKDEANGPVPTSFSLGVARENSSIEFTLDDIWSSIKDVDSPDLALDSLTLASEVGELEDLGGGKWKFTPDADWNGSVDLNVSVSDGEYAVHATGVLLIVPDNDAPVVLDIADLGSIEEDGSFEISKADLLQHVNDVDGDELTVEGLTVAEGDGEIVRLENGNWRFSPASDWAGNIRLAYQVSDGMFTEVAVADLVVQAVNDAPRVGAVADLGAVSEDNSLEITAAGLLAETIDVDGDSLTVVDLTVVQGGGILTDKGNGVWDYTLAADFNGTVKFDFSVSDGTYLTPASAELKVDPVNDSPVAGAAIMLADVAEDESLTFSKADLLANASDIDGDSLDVVNLSVSSGSLVDNGDDTWTFTPTHDFNGSVNLSYEVSDGNLSTPASAGFTVTAVNDVPVFGAAIDLGSVGEDAPLLISAVDLLANASDIDGDSLSVTNLSVSSGALVDNGDNTWTYTPDQDFNGSVSLSYDVSDGHLSAPASAGITVTAVNDTPVAGITVDLGNVVEDNSLLISAADLLANATDVDGDSLSVANLSVSSGSLVDNGDNTWTFTPAQDFNGSVSLSYDVSDGDLNAPASAGLTVTAVNDAPLSGAAVDLGNMSEDTPLLISTADLLANASDVEGDSLSVVNLSVSSGALVDNGDSTWTYTPAKDYSGPVSFSYEVSDGQLSAPASAALAVTAVNDAPVSSAVIDLGNVAEDNSLIISAADLLVNASDVEGDSLSVANLSVSSGSLVDNGDNTWIFKPAQDFNGPVSLSYEVSDGHLSAPTSAGIIVTAVNDAPTFGSAIDLGSVDEDTPFLISAADLLANASDIDGDSLSIASLTVSSGSLVDNGDSTWTYTPAQNFNGPVSLSYEVSDGKLTAPATAGLTVAAVNDAPVVNAETYLGNVASGTFKYITSANLLANVSDIEGDSLSITNLTIASGSGSLFRNADNFWTFTSSLSGVGEVELAFDVSDGDQTIAGRAKLTTTGAELDQNVVYGSGGDDFMRGLTVGDALYGRSGDDTMVGDSGDDYLNGGNGDDTLSGGIGEDRLYGGNDADKLYGGEGDDGLYGGSGDDEFHGDSGNDRLYGDVGNDTFHGGTGDDRLYGGEGDDTYLFNEGDGSDQIYDNSGSNTAVFGEGITQDELWFFKTGADLTVGVIGSADKLSVDGWYSSQDNHLAEFKLSDGSVLVESQVQGLVEAMSSYSPSSAGILTVPSEIHDGAQSMIAASWEKN
ncbi:tandem-95 repeat protein [Marinifilum sp. JC120]|nr:tandem-95 repeat protein [Marinifilum sp. JC120]